MPGPRRRQGARCRCRQLACAEAAHSRGTGAIGQLRVACGADAAVRARALPGLAAPVTRGRRTGRCVNLGLAGGAGCASLLSRPTAIRASGSGGAAPDRSTARCDRRISVVVLIVPRAAANGSIAARVTDCLRASLAVADVVACTTPRAGRFLATSLPAALAPRYHVNLRSGETTR